LSIGKKFARKAEALKAASRGPAASSHSRAKGWWESVGKCFPHRELPGKTDLPGTPDTSRTKEAVMGIITGRAGQRMAHR
jgi:hypothetical protein